MLYLVSIVIVLIGIYFYWEHKKQANLKRYGIKVVGTILNNDEGSPNSIYRLGGNINNPTVRFITVDGEEVIGKPITGFISQHEVVVPSQIFIIYDRHNPLKFCVV